MSARSAPLAIASEANNPRPSQFIQSVASEGLIMGTHLSGRFETRRDAEMTVERLVQEFGINRADVFVVAAGRANTAGERMAGSDTRSAEPSEGGRQDAELNGPIEVSVDIQDEAKAAEVRKAFAEFGASGVEQD